MTTSKARRRELDKKEQIRRMKKHVRRQEYNKVLEQYEQDKFRMLQTLADELIDTVWNKQQ